MYTCRLGNAVLRPRQVLLYMGSIMDLEAWKEKQRHHHGADYTHFDHRISLDRCWETISDPYRVATHGFYPLIHYTKLVNRMKDGKPTDPKTRDICYAAHLDSWILRYYAWQLNERYNQRLLHEGLYDVAVAYRTDLHKSNIDFSKTAFEFIDAHAPCHVIVGDFHDFFGHLDHRYLKERLCDLLQVTYLPADHYNIFHNITRYSYWERLDLLHANGLEDTSADIKTFNHMDLAVDPEYFHTHKDQIHCHKGSYGIPQGTPISAVYANIYMLSFDQKIKQLMDQANGMYMRYCDDFIVILPDQGGSDFETIRNTIRDIAANTPELILQEEKTRCFHLEDHRVLALSPNNKNEIDFLGFTFNGQTIRICDRTTSRYYHKMHRKVRGVREDTDHPHGTKHLYTKYSCKGASYQQKHRKGPAEGTSGNGNYLDYIHRAAKSFTDSSLSPQITQPTRHHMERIALDLNRQKKKNKANRTGTEGRSQDLKNMSSETE